MEGIDGGDVTASNSDDVVICIKKCLITDVIYHVIKVIFKLLFGAHA